MDENKSLITGNIPPELIAIQKEKFQAALTNLITGKTPREIVFQRPVGKGINADYVPGWWFIEQLNALFGYFWDFEIEAQEVGKESCWVRGKLTVKNPDTNLTVTKTAFGGSKLKSQGNPAIDIGDDLKTAATDALKKAATLLGVAADVYGKREVQNETVANRTQLDALYKAGEKKNITKEQVDKLSVDRFEEEPSKLETVKVLALLNEIRSK